MHQGFNYIQRRRPEEERRRLMGDLANCAVALGVAAALVAHPAITLLNAALDLTY